MDMAISSKGRRCRALTARQFLRLDGHAFPTEIQTKGKCRMFTKRAFALLLTLVMLLSLVSVTAIAAPGDDATEPGSTTEQPVAPGVESGDIIRASMSYKEYLEKYADAATDVPDVVIDFANPSKMGEGTKIETVEGEQAIVIGQDSFAEYTVNVEKSGFYVLNTRYLVPEGKPINAEASISIDGAIPYTEATTVTFTRIWKDAPYEEGVKLNEYGHMYDASGNELTPDTVGVYKWSDYVMHDNDYTTDADMRFYLEAGKAHVIRIELVRESLAFAKLELTEDKPLRTYADALAEYEKNGYAKYEGEVITVHAENTSERSDQNLNMTVDYASASTTPAHPSQTRLNTVGGELWTKTGQWVSWDVTVPKAGLYTISFKYRQDFVRGFKVYRTISVNGVVPFAEFDGVEFKSNTDWNNYTASNNGEAYYVYLNEGVNNIRLTATLGPVADSLQVLGENIAELNAIYLEIIQITGTSPDANRDYDIDKAIPDLTERFQNVRNDLVATKKAIDEINAINGKVVSGGQAAFIDVMVKQLDSFLKDMREVTGALSAYKSNISSLSDMLRTLGSQSLLLDTLYIGGLNSVLPKEKVDFFESTGYAFRGFFSSFVTDYNAFGNIYEDGAETGYKCAPVEVWMTAGAVANAASSSGRDQMNILKGLVDDRFVKEYNIPVNISLVDVNGSLSKAIIAGTGPDCAVMISSETPVNYSMRGALEDMEQFNAENQLDENGEKKYRYTFDEVKSWFYDSAFISMRYVDGKTYGLPETQTFDMLFYRTDILEKLGLEPPETWQELYNCVTIIQRQNMNIGMSGVGMFTNMLFQNGGTYYVDDFSAVNFGTEAAIEAFRDCTEFNTKYSLPITYDALNRFRTGEFPFIVASYTFCNNLAVGAPEIKGLWDMTSIPGTIRADGTMSKAQVSTGTASIMLKDCENKEAVYDFMAWWVSGQTQADFGNKIEARLGQGGRYSTANQEAFKQLSWTTDEQTSIINAWNHVTDTPKIPGDYYITRMVNNAYRAVVYQGQNPREALLRYSGEMDKEIQRKRVEYNVEEIQKAAAAAR